MGEPHRALLDSAKELLERHGYTVVKTDRIRSIEVGHRLSMIDLLQIRDLDAMTQSILSGLSAELGRGIVNQGAAKVSVIDGKKVVPERLIGYQVTVIMPEQTK